VIAPLVRHLSPAESERECPTRLRGRDDHGAVPRNSDGFLTPGRFALFLGAILAAAYPDVIFGGRSFFYRDFGLFGYPLAFFHRSAFWSGHLPLWNPLNNCGLPFLAQWNTMVLYPLSFLYLLLPLPWSLNIFCLGHLWLAGLGMYFLARNWTGNPFAAGVAGLAFALNGLTLHCLMWPNNVAGLAWMPWTILAVERAWVQGGRWILTAALVAAIQMLAGAPEVILFTWLLLGVFSLSSVFPVRPFRSLLKPGRWRAVWRLGQVAAVTVGLTAVQLLPFLDLLAHSQRDKNFAGNHWAMPSWGWANLVVPLFHSTPSLVGVYSQDEQQWTSSYYMGIGVLALAVLALLRARTRRVRILGAVTLAGLVLSLGENGPVYGWLRAVFPPLGFIRFPVKFVILAVWAVPLLAASALAARPSMPPGRWAQERNRAWLVGLGLLGVAGGIITLAWFYPVAGEVRSTTVQSGLTRCLFLAAILGLLYLPSRIQSQRQGLGFKWLALGLVAADALTHVPRQNPAIASSALQPGLIRHSLFSNFPAARAMISPRMGAFLRRAATADLREYALGQRNALYPNWNLLDRVPVVTGFYSLYLKEQRQVESLLYGRGQNYPQPLADFLGVARISSDEDLFAWKTRHSALPLLTVGQEPVFLPERATLERMASPDFHPATQVLLPAEASRSLPVRSAALGRILSSRIFGEEIEAEVESASPALVVIAQTYSRWWRAFVDGKPAPLWRANRAFQAVAVPAGRHQIRIIYQDGFFRAGAWISALALGASLTALLVGRKAKETGRSTTLDSHPYGNVS
jgi:hypothetical protein